MKTFRQLERSYLDGLEKMAVEDIGTFLALLKADKDAPYRERRIEKIEFYLDRLERKKESEIEYEKQWKKAALEYKELEEKWLSLGAKWVCKKSYTTWYYKGEEFYRWWSGTLIVENLPLAKAADKKLMSLIREEKSKCKDG